MPISAEILVGPPKPEQISPDSLRTVPNCLRERQEPIRFSDDGPRVFDPAMGCWVVEAPEVVVLRPSGASVRPFSDASGVVWDVWDTTMGVILWTFEAFDFDRALVEKRRLCRGSRGKSGWARLSRRD